MKLADWTEGKYARFSFIFLLLPIYIILELLKSTARIWFKWLRSTFVARLVQAFKQTVNIRTNKWAVAKHQTAVV